MKNIYETIAFAEISEDEQVVELLENIAESELKQQFLFAGKKGSAQNTLTIYRQSDKTETKYNGDFEENEITEWLNEYYLPFIQELTFSTLKHYYAKQAPVCYLLMDADEEKEDRPSVQLISELNNEFYGKVWFVWAYSNELPTLADRYLITEFPGMVLINNINKEHYTYKGKFTKNEIKNWLNDFFAGKVEKSIKKELIPESNDGLIKTVVYDNWDEIVNDPEKDVLIKIYADWCQHCKKLEPVYQELAEKFQDSQNLVFAQINGDKNEIKPDLKVSGYPTIMLFPAENKKEFILFEEEERSIETLSKFLTENCKTTETIIKDNSSEEGADEKMQEDQKKEEEEEPIKEL
ncbi:protein disulfide isomerase [Anaeramoeba flamelloides]|uniref:protein disulfide-isomerase n=1 Tax=Anaeramoeba flamelloides TaxID=1746091 RepID=A0AAV7YE25_9EUKA|nr:protein disulfide isomerase [Anaeramoeba flamelloides]